MVINSTAVQFRLNLGLRADFNFFFMLAVSAKFSYSLQQLVVTFSAKKKKRKGFLVQIDIYSASMTDGTFENLGVRNDIETQGFANVILTKSRQDENGPLVPRFHRFWLEECLLNTMKI